LNEPQVYNAAFAAKQWPLFKRKYGHQLPKEQVELFEWFAEHALDWEAAVIPRKRFLEPCRPCSVFRPTALGLCHNDFRLDNILFSRGQVKLVDWATVRP
jgi:thiamine kinase-like enzyme